MKKKTILTFIAFETIETLIVVYIFKSQYSSSYLINRISSEQSIIIEKQKRFRTRVVQIQNNLLFNKSTEEFLNARCNNPGLFKNIFATGSRSFANLKMVVKRSQNSLSLRSSMFTTRVTNA